MEKIQEIVSLDQFPVRELAATRVSDQDGYGHLNAIRIAQIYEDFRARFYRTAFDNAGGLRMPVVDLHIRYLGEAFWPDELQIGSGIASIGNSSFQMLQGLFSAGRCLGTCRTVLVHMTRGTAASLPIDLRSNLEAMLIGTTH